MLELYSFNIICRKHLYRFNKSGELEYITSLTASLINVVAPRQESER